MLRMGTTIRVRQVDPSGDDEEAPEERELDLDQSWEGLAEILDALGLEDPFLDGFELLAEDVDRYAKALKPYTWEKVQELVDDGAFEHVDPEYHAAYFEDFRELVLAAARANSALIFEAL